MLPEFLKNTFSFNILFAPHLFDGCLIVTPIRNGSAGTRPARRVFARILPGFV